MTYSVLILAACLAGFGAVLYWLSETVAVSWPERYATVVEHKKAVWRK